MGRYDMERVEVSMHVGTRLELSKRVYFERSILIRGNENQRRQHNTAQYSTKQQYEQKSFIVLYCTGLYCLVCSV